MIKGDKPYFHVADQNFLSEWHGCSFLGYHLNVVAIERKYFLWSLIVGVSCEIGWQVAPEFSIWLLILVLCKKPGWLPWDNWCLFWGCWLESGCTRGKNLWAIFQWKWLFMGILWLGGSPCKILTGVSGYPIIYVIILNVPIRSRSCLTSEFWLKFEMLLLFCDFLPTPCSLGCRLMFLGKIPVLWWYWPRLAPCIGVTPYPTGSLFPFWPHSSVLLM